MYTATSTIRPKRCQRDQGVREVSEEVLHVRGAAEGKDDFLLEIAAEQGRLRIRGWFVQVRKHGRVVGWFRACRCVGGRGIFCVADEEVVEVIGDFLMLAVYAWFKT